MIKMVVFDMAGTTVNEDNLVYKTLQQSINKNGFNISLREVLAEGAGKEKLQAIKSILKAYAQTENEELSGRIYAEFIKTLTIAYEEQEVYPMEHATEVFNALKARNVLVVLNTGYNAETAESLIDKLKWRAGEDFDGMVTASDVENNRPQPDMILAAMERFGITDAKQVVKVGDSMIDIEEGKNAGCRMSIGITTGAHTREQLQSASPDSIINDLLELLPLLQHER